jgi:NAD(P)-dependent dehydrogenase (short-subunit alcohol dehydrogenase family)
LTDVTGKVAFITGGARGIGLAIASALVKRGCHVMLADLDNDALQQAATSLESTGGQVGTVICDVRSADAMQAAADATITRFGKVNIIVNNAGVAVGGMSGKLALADWQWVIDINLLGVVHGVEIFLPLIRSHGEGGHIVNTASMAGHVASPGMSPYHATKFAVVGYSESLQADLAKENIGVSVLCPAWVRTDIHKSGFAKPTGGGSVDDPQFKAMSAVVDNGLDANVVGEWTAQCITDDRFYIFTHPEFKQYIDMRHDTIAADYAACAEYDGFGKA